MFLLLLNYLHFIFQFDRFDSTRLTKTYYLWEYHDFSLTTIFWINVQSHPTRLKFYQNATKFLYPKDFVSHMVKVSCGVPIFTPISVKVPFTFSFFKVSLKVGCLLILGFLSVLSKLLRFTRILLRWLS